MSDLRMQAWRKSLTVRIFRTQPRFGQYLPASIRLLSPVLLSRSTHIGDEQPCHGVGGLFMYARYRSGDLRHRSHPDQATFTRVGSNPFAPRDEGISVTVINALSTMRCLARSS